MIVSPMERRAFDDGGKVRASLADYAEGARQAAKENDAVFIDLHAASIPFYEAVFPSQRPGVKPLHLQNSQGVEDHRPRDG